MMKRSPALAPLSREHHLALVVARNLSHATSDDAEAATAGFMEFMTGHELGHFAAEESVLLPAAPDEPRGRELGDQVRADHDYLRDALRRLQAADAATTSVPLLRQLGARLRAHVQLEERELFPYVERSLSAQELDELGARLAAERSQGSSATRLGSRCSSR